MNRQAAVPYEKLKPIRVMLLDVDGILTDGRIVLGCGPDGGAMEFKAFSAYDGQGLILAMQAGIELGLVTSRESPLVARRAQELGIDHVFQNAKVKWPVVESFLRKRKYRARELLYMGDDFPDLPVLKYAGFSATVPGAPLEIRSAVDYVTDQPGGEGAVREVVEMMLKAKGQWAKIVAGYANFRLKI